MGVVMTAFRVTKAKMSGRTVYAVIDQSGERVSALLHSQTQADTICDYRNRLAAKRARQQVRPCITCGREIHSEGPHHRMCDPCRRRASEIF